MKFIISYMQQCAVTVKYKKKKKNTKYIENQSGS